MPTDGSAGHHLPQFFDQFDKRSSNQVLSSFLYFFNTAICYFKQRFSTCRRFVSDSSAGSFGIQLDPKTVLKLMIAIDLTCQVRVKKYRPYPGNVEKVASNVLIQDFTAEKLNQKWVNEVTEFALFGQKLYLSPMLDLFNSETIAYTVQSRPTYDLVSPMLDQAFEYLDHGEELVPHSDQGWHYQLAKYQTGLVNRNITQSMSRKGNFLDNTVIENFFGILKTELL